MRRLSLAKMKQLFNVPMKFTGENVCWIVLFSLCNLSPEKMADLLMRQDGLPPNLTDGSDLLGSLSNHLIIPPNLFRIKNNGIHSLLKNKRHQVDNRSSGMLLPSARTT